MTISEVIDALIEIRNEHGDLPMLHHDDWDDFLVEAVKFQPAYKRGWTTPAHVVIEVGKLV